MTNHRPDIYCDGCGDYCYSLSHLPWEQKFPERHYCKTCTGAVARGVHTMKMLALQWLRMSGEVRYVFKIEHPEDAENVKDKISSFVLTTESRGFPSEARIVGEPHVMSVASWQQYARNKLRHYRQYCTNEEFDLLSAYIAAAPLFEQPTDKILAARRAVEDERNRSLGAIIFGHRARLKRAATS